LKRISSGTAKDEEAWMRKSEAGMDADGKSSRLSTVSIYSTNANNLKNSLFVRTDSNGNEPRYSGIGASLAETQKND